MKKTKLTLQRHREMGAALKAFRNNHLIKFQVAFMIATSHTSRQSKAVTKALAAIDELKNVMDALVHKDYFDEIGDEFKKIYYGPNDAKK